MSLSTAPAVVSPRTSRWVLLLVVLWSLLALRIGFAVARAEPLGDDLALPTVALFVSSALLGSRLWSAFKGRGEGPRP
jgi:hypothetical protein